MDISWVSCRFLTRAKLIKNSSLWVLIFKCSQNTKKFLHKIVTDTIISQLRINFIYISLSQYIQEHVIKTKLTKSFKMNVNENIED